MFIHIVEFYILSSMFQYINAKEERLSVENGYRTLEKTKWVCGMAD